MSKILDLRNVNHPEYDTCVYSCEGSYYDKEIANAIFNTCLLTEVGWFNKMYNILGNAKGVIKYRIRHGKDTYSRYKNIGHEPLENLLNIILLKHKGKIYRGYNGYQRMDVIKSVNDLCLGISEPKVLEVGCGSGLNMYLLNNYNQEIEIYGFEYTNNRIVSSIRNLTGTPMEDNLFLADVTDIKIPDNSFDVVYSNHVLEQLGQENAERALREMWRVCRYGIVLSEPSTFKATLYEQWRMNTLGYCKNLHKVAIILPKAKEITYREDTFRTYPNTSMHLIVKKM